MSNLIIGDVTPTTARIWVRGEKKSGNAKLRYRPADGSAPWQTVTTPLEPFRGYTAILVLEGLAPSRDYECQLSYTNAKSKPPLVRAGTFTTAPDAPRDIAFILASCNYANLEVLTSKNVDVAWEGIGALATAADADFMIHCGDQIYGDLPGVEFPTLLDYQEKYQSTWSHKPTARVLAQLPHYMMLDDHEIFDAFANDVEYLWRPSAPVRDVALEAYRQYQHSHNPQTYPPPALYYRFEFAGVHFFALDVRSERWKRKDPQMIGGPQLAEFLRWLTLHRDEPKFVITSIPFIAEVRERDDKWCGDEYRVQREQIIDHLGHNQIGRLCFMTGDMHCSYHMQMTITPAGGPPVTVHELMSSPINQVTSGSHAIIANPLPATTVTNVTYQTAPLDLAEFYGEHSNVMLLKYARPSRRASWEIYRTKRDLPPPRTGSFVL
jgi:alkaline phosphatase D